MPDYRVPRTLEPLGIDDALRHDFLRGIGPEVIIRGMRLTRHRIKEAERHREYYARCQDTEYTRLRMLHWRTQNRERYRQQRRHYKKMRSQTEKIIDLTS